MIKSIFDWGVYTLEVIGDITGWGYMLANIIIFIIFQPALIVLFFILWLYERNKINQYLKRHLL